MAGAATSTLCLIHCLLTPVALSFFPNVISWLPGDAVSHRLLAVAILLFGAAGFVPGYRLHRRKSLLVLITAGITLILLVACNGEVLGTSLELFLSVTGSAMLIAAHLLNRSFCRQCRACAEAMTQCHTTHLP